jgi:GNAT superfamily N-acetyltransferase
MYSDHPLAEVFRRAARGEFPAPDGSVEVLAPAAPRIDAVIAFTAHNYIAANVDADWVRARVAHDPIAAPLSIAFTSALAAKLGAAPRTGVVDAVLARLGTGGKPEIELVEAGGPSPHPRVAASLAFRDDVRVFETADGAGFFILGFGLAGRLEVAFEVKPEQRGRGLGRRLLAAALQVAGKGTPVFAQVAPGNAASMGAVIACGFRPIGAEIGFLRAEANRPSS